MSNYKFDNIVTQVRLGGKCVERFSSQDLESVPLDKLYAHGFRNWDGKLLLLPLWALEYMEHGTVLHCIDGDQATVGVNQIDDDTRGGVIAFGIHRTDIPKKDI